MNEFKYTLLILLVFTLNSCRVYNNPFDPLYRGGEGAIIIFQEGVNGYTGTKDTHVMEYNNPPTVYDGNNTGANDRLETARYLALDPGSDRSILIEFDVSAIPANATVIQAILELYFLGERNGIGASKTLNMHQITSSWVEGNGTGDDGQFVDGITVVGVTWSDQPTYNPASLDAETIADIINTWHDFDITTTVQSWVSNSSTNYGVLLKEDAPSNNQGTKLFASSENATISIRPKLTVTFN